LKKIKLTILTKTYVGGLPT